MKKQVEIIVLGPSLKQIGGVSNYYNALRLDSEDNILYFEVNSYKKESLFKKTYRLIKNYCRFIWMLSKRNVKLIHVNPSLDSKSFFRDAIFILLGRLFLKKIIVFFRGWEDNYEKKINSNLILKFILHSTYVKSDAFIVLGEIFKRKLINLGVKSNHPFYLETTVADSSYLSNFNLQEKLKTYDSEVKILFISRIEKEKGIYIAMDACCFITNLYPGHKIKLVVAGKGKELEKAKAYAKEKKLGMIEFVGQVQGSDKGKLLNECHIMLFPTYYGEGMPNSILEGMLYGMPIISRINAGIPDVVANDINGYLSESLDANVYANYLIRLVLDKSTFARISESNHKVAMNKFTTEKVKERLLNIYKTTLNK